MSITRQLLVTAVLAHTHLSASRMFYKCCHSSKDNVSSPTSRSLY